MRVIVTGFAGQPCDPINTNIVHGGIQIVYRFTNDYGASVVKHSFSYGSEQGLWELAVLKFDGEGSSLCYDTPITGDVLGRLSEQEVVRTLQKIKDLP